MVLHGTSLDVAVSRLIMVDKTFANCHRNAKFTEVFSHEINPLYGNSIVLHQKEDGFDDYDLLTRNPQETIPGSGRGNIHEGHAPKPIQPSSVCTIVC